jgi:hypothetical protein
MAYFYHEDHEGHEEIKIFDGNNFMLFMVNNRSPHTDRLVAVIIDFQEVRLAQYLSSNKSA